MTSPMTRPMIGTNPYRPNKVSKRLLWIAALLAVIAALLSFLSGGYLLAAAMTVQAVMMGLAKDFRAVAVMFPVVGVAGAFSYWHSPALLIVWLVSIGLLSAGMAALLLSIRSLTSEPHP